MYGVHVRESIGVQDWRQIVRESYEESVENWRRIYFQDRVQQPQTIIVHPNQVEATRRLLGMHDDNDDELLDDGELFEDFDDESDDEQEEDQFDAAVREFLGHEQTDGRTPQMEVPVPVAPWEIEEPRVGFNPPIPYPYTVRTVDGQQVMNIAGVRFVKNPGASFWRGELEYRGVRRTVDITDEFIEEGEAERYIEREQDRLRREYEDRERIVRGAHVTTGLGIPVPVTLRNEAEHVSPSVRLIKVFTKLLYKRLIINEPQYRAINDAIKENSDASELEFIIDAICNGDI